MFIRGLFLGGCISYCWPANGQGNWIGRDGDRKAVAKDTQYLKGKTQLCTGAPKQGQRSSRRMLCPSSRGTTSDSRAVQQPVQVHGEHTVVEVMVLGVQRTKNHHARTEAAANVALYICPRRHRWCASRIEGVLAGVSRSHQSWN